MDPEIITEAWEFLSTPSARRATTMDLEMSLVEEYFYPRPPRGGRPGVVLGRPWSEKFLSTPSARRAT